MVDTRTELSETEEVKGAEFERKVRKLARSKGVTCSFVSAKGKGSHGRLFFGGEIHNAQGSKEGDRARSSR